MTKTDGTCRHKWINDRCKKCGIPKKRLGEIQKVADQLPESIRSYFYSHVYYSKVFTFVPTKEDWHPCWEINGEQCVLVKVEENHSPYIHVCGLDDDTLSLYGLPIHEALVIFSEIIKNGATKSFLLSKGFQS